jgi:hypothetical protein
VIKPPSKSDVDRLGKPGSYRLGRQAALGVGQPSAPRPLRPSFSRPQHSGLVIGWIVAAVAGTALIVGAAMLGWWFVPFVVGLATGVADRWGGWRLRVTIPAVIVMAAAGWGLALWIPALRGLPVAATGRTIAALAGLPAAATAGIAVTLGVSVVQALAGLWLGRAVAPGASH